MSTLMCSRVVSTGTVRILQGECHWRTSPPPSPGAQIAMAVLGMQGLHSMQFNSISA